MSNRLPKICALAMSHAQTDRRMLVGSLLTKEHLTGWLYTANLTGWLYTANAATVSKKRSVCEPVCMAHCVPPKSSTVRKTGIYLSGKRWKMIQLSQAEKYLTRAVLKKNTPLQVTAAGQEL